MILRRLPLMPSFTAFRWSLTRRRSAPPVAAHVLRRVNGPADMLNWRPDAI
jgi:hypothetical protein